MNTSTQHSPCETPAWQALAAHAAALRDTRLRTLFGEDPRRFERFSLAAAGLTLDYSKNRVDARALELLFALARERGLEAARDQMFAGVPINNTEGRAVLHVALRAPAARASRSMART